MPTHIDQFQTLSGVAIIRGWSSEYAPGRHLAVLQDGEPVHTVTVGEPRPDVAAHHGPEAAAWGFRAYGITPDGSTRADRTGLRFSPTFLIEFLAAIPRPVEENPHGLWQDFINEINARGGTVLELGARARSGNTSREHFGSNVRYVGMDISPGPNVDVVGDAHGLSTFIDETVDFIFSISTFEHFLMPWKVAIEMNKVLRVGGKVFSHSHQTWPGHDEPWEYFRFSKEAWGSLFNAHTGFRVVDARRGEPVSIASRFNWGGPFQDMEHSPGWAMSVSVSEKTHEARVAWDADVSDITKIEYLY